MNRSYLTLVRGIQTRRDENLPKILFGYPSQHPTDRRLRHWVQVRSIKSPDHTRVTVTRRAPCQLGLYYILLALPNRDSDIADNHLLPSCLKSGEQEPQAARSKPNGYHFRSVPCHL